MNGYEIELRGFVQGQGIRPALARLANQRHWTGSVCNTSKGVRLTLGPIDDSVDDIKKLIRQCHAALTEASLEMRPASITAAAGFRIESSTNTEDLAAHIPRDAAVCETCLSEFQDPDDRRFADPLISCVRCGPRFSAIASMPFDRARTTLCKFPLCDACQAEYGSSDPRRGHSQTISCPQCGPCVWAEDRNGRSRGAGEDACLFAASALRRGEIIALRGIGGYQLLVDATDHHAVNELRRRKRRTTKPFAVLCRTLEEAETLGEFDSTGRRALTSPANPIVIVPRRCEARLAAGVHPHLAEIGLLLPTTALHGHLLELVGRPLVCTSGNREGVPLVVEVDDAKLSLAGIADAWLHHNRPITHPLDDSVVRPVAGRIMTLRCARGLAPLPLPLANAPPAIALGSYQKSACAYSNGAQSVLGPYIGDLDQISSRERWDQSLASLQRAYRIASPQWAVDAHPDDICHTAVPPEVKTESVWHHHAHLAAGMLEHGWLDRTVMGMAADGQGYGPDGTLWGGEILQVSAHGFRRLASVRQFTLCGGEAAVRDPVRLAMTLLSQLPEVSVDMVSRLLQQDLARTRNILFALRSSRSLQTSSLGRLMDGVAWLVLRMEDCGYVGEPAVRLESACDPRTTGSYRWTIHDRSEPWELDWRPALRSVLEDVHGEVAPGIVAERFHRGIVDCILELRARFPTMPWVFSGGVFQNRRLCELLAHHWPSSAPPLGLPGVIPPNDGGLAAGQLAIVAARHCENRTVPHHQCLSATEQ